MTNNFLDIIPEEIILYRILRPDRFINKLLLCRIVNKCLYNLVNEIVKDMVYSYGRVRGKRYLNYEEILKFISSGYRMIKLENINTNYYTLHYIINFQIPRNIINEVDEVSYTIITIDGILLNVFPKSNSIQIINYSKQYKLDFCPNMNILFLMSSKSKMFDFKTKSLKNSYKY